MLLVCSRRSREADRDEREAAARKLALAYQWAVLHPACEETGVATHGGAALMVLHHPETLGGDGTPEVAAFAPETLAVRLGISPAAAAALIGDALDLVHRHPLLWRRVRSLQVPGWQARRVVQQTRTLPTSGAHWVDEQLAARRDGGVRAGGGGPAGRPHGRGRRPRDPAGP